MYHLLKGLHAYLTQKDEYSVVIIGLDNAGKTTTLEKIKTLYNPAPGMPPEKIGPTVGQNIGKINLPSTTLHFFDLGGQRDIRSIWPKYYDECHAVVFVLDAVDQGRLSETWEVFDEVLNSPRLLNLPLLLLANKQDAHGSLSVAEIRESFDAWSRARSARHAEEGRTEGVGGAGPHGSVGKGKGKGKQTTAEDVDRANGRQTDEAEDGAGPEDPPDEASRAVQEKDGEHAGQEGWDDGGAREERLASLDVMGVSALEG